MGHLSGRARCLAVAAMALAAGASGCGRQAPAVAGALAPPGTERRWAVRLQVELATPSHSNPVSIVLTGRWSVTTTAIRAGEHDVECALNDASIEGSGVPRASSAELEALLRRLGRPFWVTYRNDGAALRVHFPRTMEPSDRNLLQMLVTDAQLVRPGRDETAWTALERDAAGLYLAAYHRPGPDRVVKRKLKYVETDGPSTDAGGRGGLAVEVSGSERTFTLDRTGEIAKLQGEETSAIALPLTEGQALRVRTSLELGDLHLARSPGRAGSLERARADVEVSPIRTHRPSQDAAQAMRDARLVEGHTAAELLGAAGAQVKPGTSADPQLAARLEALFRREPASVTAAVEMARGRRGLALLTDALGSASTKVSLDALLVLARDSTAPVSLRVDALRACLRAKQPRPPLLDGIRDLLGDRDRTVRNAAQLVLGGLAHAARPSFPGEANAVDEELARRYLGSTDARERVALSGALGNSAGAAAAEALRRGLRDRSAEIRAAAARDLRNADGDEFDRALVEALRGDPDPRVRAGAVFAIDYRRVEPFVEALADVATHDKVEYVRSAAVSLLGKHWQTDPAAERALREVAGRDPSRGMRRLAAELLQRRPSANRR